MDCLRIKSGIPALYAIEEDMVMFVFECLFPVLVGLNPNEVVFLVPDTETFIQVITCVFIWTSLQVLPTSCTLPDFACNID